MTSRELLQGILGLLLSSILVPIILFLSAGTLDWPQAWIYTAMYLTAALGGRLLVYRINPDTLRERARSLSADKIMPGDRVIVIVIGIIGPLLMMSTAGLDHRFQISPSVPIILWVNAVILVSGGYLVAVWALVSNPFFSAVARLQDDRGQIVVKEGPYRYIRHPGYAGGIVSTFAAAIVLGSYLALIPGLLIAIVYVIRTSREDQMLATGLDGYPEYSANVRFRLLPGVW